MSLVTWELQRPAYCNKVCQHWRASISFLRSCSLASFAAEIEMEMMSWTIWGFALMGSAPTSWLPSTRLPQVTALWKMHANCTRVQMALRQTSAPGLGGSGGIGGAFTTCIHVVFFEFGEGFSVRRKAAAKRQCFCFGGLGLRAIAQHG